MLKTVVAVVAISVGVAGVATAQTIRAPVPAEPAGALLVKHDKEDNGRGRKLGHYKHHKAGDDDDRDRRRRASARSSGGSVPVWVDPAPVPYYAPPGYGSSYPPAPYGYYYPLPFHYRDY
jgi:hypothetical protein